MINYSVQPGDVLGVLAVKYQTTIQTLMSDNPFIPSDQKLSPGWTLKIYTPQENVERNADASYQSIEIAYDIQQQIADTGYLTAIPKSPIYYKNRLVSDGVMAFIRTVNPTKLYELEFDGFIKYIRDVAAGEIFGVYQIAELGGDPAYIVEGYHWIYDDPTILYDAVPLQVLEGAISLNNQSAIDTGKLKATVISSAGFGPAPTPLSSYKISPESFVGFGKPASKQPIYSGINAQLPVFTMPSYNRPLMTLVNAAGQTTRIELRLTGFSASYTNTVTPAATNAGWMVNVRAPELPVLNISGYLLETAQSSEFDEFMSRYHKYLEASKTGDFYSMGISTLNYKATQYNGVVVSFSYTDSPQAPLHREYNMQMLVFKEKTLTTSQITNLPKVFGNEKAYGSEESFMSDIANMLADPVVGN